MRKISTVAMGGIENFKDRQLTIGLDLGDRYSHYCILNETGEVIGERNLPTTPNGIDEVFCRMPRSRIALETGTHFSADAPVANLATVLRPPQTLNHKYQPPRVVGLCERNWDRRYNLSDFDFLDFSEDTNAASGEFVGMNLPAGMDAYAATGLIAGRLKFNARQRGGVLYLDYHGLPAANGAKQPCLVQGSLHGEQATNPRQSCFAIHVELRRIAHQCFDSDCREFAQDTNRPGFENVRPGDYESKTRTALRNAGLAAEFLGEPQLDDPPKVSAETSAKSPSAPKSAALPIEDLPQAALCGRLGEICEKRLGKFPRSYAWVSLVTMAGALTDSFTDVRPNLFACLAGPVGSSKTESTKHAAKALGLGSPEVERTNAGSIEGLAAKMADAAGSARIYCPDEMIHLFEKAQIQHATFCPVLCRCFGETKFDLIVAGRKVIPFDCVLSILGGCILDDDGNGDNFHDCFGATSVGGLYDRFLFARCPRPSTYDYFSFTGGAENLRRFPRVGVDPQIWEMVKDWRRTVSGMTGRIGEIVLRVAAICCAADGETLLRPASTYTDAALALAKYQIEFRAAVKANPGENFDAKCATAIEARVRAAGADGVAQRTVYRAIHANRFGPNVFRRAAEALVLNGEMERKVRQLPSGQKSEFWAWVTA